MPAAALVAVVEAITQLEEHNVLAGIAVQKWVSTHKTTLSSQNARFLFDSFDNSVGLSVK